MDNDTPQDPAISDNMNEFENNPFPFKNSRDSPLCVYDDVSSSDTEPAESSADSEYSSSFIGLPYDSLPVQIRDNLAPVDLQDDLPSVDLPSAFPPMNNQNDIPSLDLQQDYPPLDLQHDLPPLDVPPEVPPETPPEVPPNNSRNESVSMEIENENDPIDIENDDQDEYSYSYSYSNNSSENQLPYVETDIEFTTRYLLPGFDFLDFVSPIFEQESDSTEQESEETSEDLSDVPEIYLPFFNIIVFVNHDVHRIRPICDFLSSIEGENAYNINCYHLNQLMIVMEDNPCDLCIVQSDFVQEVTITYPKAVCTALYINDEVVSVLWSLGLDIG